MDKNRDKNGKAWQGSLACRISITFFQKISFAILDKLLTLARKKLYHDLEREKRTEINKINSPNCWGSLYPEKNVSHGH